MWGKQRGWEGGRLFLAEWRRGLRPGEAIAMPVRGQLGPEGGVILVCVRG